MADQVIPRVQVGPLSSWTAGGQLNMMGDVSGAQYVSNANARYYGLAVNGRLFVASNVAAQAVSVALATTYTGLVLYNPPGSGKNVVPIFASYTPSIAEAAASTLTLIGGYSAGGGITHTTPLAAPGPRSTLLGTGPAPVAGCNSAATIPTPTYIFGLQGMVVATAGQPAAFVELAGSLVLPPGGFVAWGALTAVTGFGAFLWAEIPA